MADDGREEIREVLHLTYNTLKDIGYNAIAQITGFLITGDASYISTKNQARIKMSRLERDEILEEVLIKYFDVEED